MGATAVEAWDERWATPEGRADWLVPHLAVAALVQVLKARRAHHVLDLGCGVGRHALFFAEHDFLEYCFFVMFFPQLLAGPITHHSEIFSQIKDPWAFAIRTSNFVLGLTIFRA